LILLEEADATGGATIPPNTEKVLTFALTRDAATCGRVQSVADLMTQNGTSLSVAGFVLNYPTGCCRTVQHGASFQPDIPVTPPNPGFKVFANSFTIPAGWTLTFGASYPPGSVPPPPLPPGPGPLPSFDFIGVAALCPPAGFFQSFATNAQVNLVQPFPAETTCQLVIISSSPSNTFNDAQICPGLQAPVSQGGRPI
jgi:hypothetical protein